MAEDIVTKGRFAAIAGISQARVSQYLSDGQISGEAVVGSSHRARIRVAVAMEQLRRNLDVSQHLGANGRARVGSGDDDDTVADAIKRARLEQLESCTATQRMITPGAGVG
jgi:acyl-CoA reductase-like NAD-dependent aldehyde dehydrogenase